MTVEIMQCGIKRTHKIPTIHLNKKDNKNRTSRSFSILFSDLGSSETAFQHIFGFLVLFREIFENIDQMHENLFFSCSFSEIGNGHVEQKN